MEEPLRLKPHHAEGVQRQMAFSGKETHKGMLDQLQYAVDQNANAELIFTSDFDVFCGQGCAKKCSQSVISSMDKEIAYEHGWELGKPYKIKDILDELREEAPRRGDVYYFVKLNKKLHQKWLKEIRASKKKINDTTKFTSKKVANVMSGKRNAQERF
jgi:hypothetical protein